MGLFQWLAPGVGRVSRLWSCGVGDPQGKLQRHITRVYDALNRVQQVTGAGN